MSDTSSREQEGTEWSASFGGGYQSTTYHSVPAGEDRTQNSGIITPGTAPDMDLTKTLELVADYYSQIGFSDPKNTLHHASLLFKLDVLGDMLDFSLSFTWNHNTNPQPTEDGTLPKKSDLRTAFGIGIDI